MSRKTYTCDRSNGHRNDCKEIANDETMKTSVSVKSQCRVTSRCANALFLLLRIQKLTVLQQWTVFCLLFCCVFAREQKFALEPQDQSAVVGSRVTLPCRVVNKVGQLQWTKDDFGLGTHRHLTGYERYKMVGSDEEGDYSLDIREVTLDDDALYQCQVSSGPRGEPPIRSRYARLVVLVPPEPPKILQGSTLLAVEDREVNLECVSTGGKPPAEITWVDHDGGVMVQGVTYTTEQMADGSRHIARSALRLRPRRFHHNQTFTCQAQNTADRAYRAASIRLQVQYAPKVRVFIKSGAATGRIQEGDTLAVGCQANANPNNLTYRWFLNNEHIAGAVRNELILPNISRKFNEATVKCEVHNPVGKSADTKSLEVAYGPTFRQRPRDVEAETGSSATLTCVVDGYPSPKIEWVVYRGEHVVLAGKSSNLTVTVNAATAGQYWCKASTEGYQPIEVPAMIYVRGPPKIMSNQTQYGVEGDSVRIECISFSVPKPDYVLWSFGGNEINSFYNQEYAFLEETLTDGKTKSTLIIRESDARHFGTYNCSVSNLYGSDSIEIRLIPDKSLPLILIISSGSSAIIVILIIMLIVMLCHRRRDVDKKPDLTNIKDSVDPFKDSDRSSNISDLKMELRQVEGSCEMDASNGSDTEFHSNLQLTTNLGLPLAGPVSIPDPGIDNELMKYQRYSGDFNQAISHLNFKGGQSNGYVPYVDYSRDYAPPQPDSLTGSFSRSTEYPVQCGSLNRQASCGRLGGLVGPDVIPMANQGALSGGVDVRYAATYGNPYLRGSGPISYVPQVNTANPAATPAPPPYYSVRNNLPLPATSGTSPSSTASSKPLTSSMASSSSVNSSAQPQVPRVSPQTGLYILPPTSQGNFQSNQITAKGNGQGTGTHV
ncbi:irregular chiasm C-roughest protein-like [Cydia strobilella]|uniref:irregular chiasm C-roughest protein-like n=1 Tax=Cydia strobilella TaxID=1100964 RepID=UPI00300468E2